MSKAPPAFQFYPDRFLGGTSDFTQSEVGAYILLLCYQWNKGSIPVQPERQQMIAKGDVSKHVLSKFETSKEGVLVNKTMEEVRKKQDEYRDVQRKKGILSGQSRRTHVQHKHEHRLDSGSSPVQTGSEHMLEPDLNSLSRSPSLKDTTLNGVVLIKEVFEAWNKQTEFPQCLVLSDKRRRYLESRVKDPFFVVNWKPALDRIRKSDFCHGNGETGWKANFDWFIRPDTCARIMEGRYDNRTKTKTFVP